MKIGEVIVSDKEILGGTPVFVGTRVPIKNLFDIRWREIALKIF
ncbi:MAG: DUF433 domain-containing protein [Segetibacter sp.]